MPQDLVILNPEKTLITYKLAGLGARTGAHVIDVILVLGILFGVNVLLGLISIAAQSFGIFLMTVLSAAIPFLYFILFEAFWNGQTPGKKSAGIRVRKSDGTAVTFQAAVIRNFLRVGDFLPALYGVGILTMFLNQGSQRLGDLAANTIVIYEVKQLPFFTPAPYILGEHSCEKYLPDLNNMTVDEYVALKRMCDRFPDFPAKIQDKVLRDLWTPIAQRLGIETPQNIHPISLAEAVVMKYGRAKGLM